MVRGDGHCAYQYDSYVNPSVCVCVGGVGGGGNPFPHGKKVVYLLYFDDCLVLKKKKENCFNLLYLAIDFRVQLQFLEYSYNTYIYDMYEYMKERKEGRKEEE